MLICLNGGLGNQIGNYVFGQFLMEKGMDVEFVFSDNVNDARAIVLDRFNVDLTPAKKETIEKFLFEKPGAKQVSTLFTKNIFDKIWRNNLWNFLKRIRAEYNIYPKKTPFLLSKIVSYKDVLKYGCRVGAVCDCYSPIPEFNDEKFKEKMQKQLTLKEPLDEKNNQILKMIKNAKNPVGVHIRRGDFIDFKFPVVKSEFLIEKMEYMMKTLMEPEFFIFSNGMDWAKETLKGFNNVHFVDINDEAHGYLDFVLFNECIHRIYSNSTFSLWARYLNRHKEGFEFYPDENDMQVEEKA